MTNQDKHKKFNELLVEHCRFISYSKRLYVNKYKQPGNTAEDCAQEISMCLWNSINMVNEPDDTQIMRLFKKITYRRIRRIARPTADAMDHLNSCMTMSDNFYEEIPETTHDALKGNVRNVAIIFYNYARQDHNRLNGCSERILKIIKLLIKPNKKLKSIIMDDTSTVNEGILKQRHFAIYFNVSEKVISLNIKTIKEMCNVWMRNNNLTLETVLN